MHRPIGRYRRLKYTITDIVKHDTSFAARLFSVATCERRVVYAKMGVRVPAISCLSDVSATSLRMSVLFDVLNTDRGR